MPAASRMRRTKASRPAPAVRDSASSINVLRSDAKRGSARAAMRGEIRFEEYTGARDRGFERASDRSSDSASGSACHKCAAACTTERGRVSTPLLRWAIQARFASSRAGLCCRGTNLRSASAIDGGFRRRLGRLRATRFRVRAPDCCAARATAVRSPSLRSRGVTGCEACGMPLAADVEPQLAAARVANGDGFEDGADAPLREQARARAAARSEKIDQVDTHGLGRTFHCSAVNCFNNLAAADAGP